MVGELEFFYDSKGDHEVLSLQISDLCSFLDFGAKRMPANPPKTLPIKNPMKK